MAFRTWRHANSFCLHLSIPQIPLVDCSSVNLQESPLWGSLKKLLFYFVLQKKTLSTRLSFCYFTAKKYSSKVAQTGHKCIDDLIDRRVNSFWNALCQVLTLPQDRNCRSTLLNYPQFNNLPCWVYGHAFVQTCFPSISALVWGLIALSWLLSRMKEICLSRISPAIFN